MEATGDRSAIVSASLPQLVQYSGQGFNQLHLPPPALHSVSLSNSPSESFFQSYTGVSVCCKFMPFRTHSLILSILYIHVFLALSLHRLHPLLPPSPVPLPFIDCSGSIIDFSDPLTALTWHSDIVFISCLSQSTQPEVFDPCTDCQ